MAKALLKVGSQGPSVKEAQKLLGVGADGIFGPKTEAATKAFQKKHGLTEDGIIGPATWKALDPTPAVAPPDPLLSGPALVLPISPSRKPYLTVGSPYGPRTSPITGKESFHSGIDIGAAQGTPLIAIGSGLVGKVQELHAVNGNAVFLDVDGYRVCYLHLYEIHVSEGEAVVVGQTIGLVGTTGQSTGPHLHLTIYDPSGNRIDPATLYPAEWLRNRQGEPLLG